MYKLIIAEDEELERRVLQHTLRDYDLPLSVVGEAATGREAVRLAGELTPDIIIIDIKMPGLNGLKAVEQIKKIKPDIEVIILTAYGTFAYSQQAIKLKVADYLLKPVQPEELLECLKKVIKQLKEKRQTPGPVFDMTPSLEFNINDLVEQIKSCNQVKARQTVLRAVENFLSEKKENPPHRLASFAFELLVICSQSLYATDMSRDKLSALEKEFAEEIKTISSPRQLRSWAEKMVFSMIVFLKESLLTGEQLIIKRAQEYILKNYQNEITLSQVAAHVHLSNSYFSRFFKRKTGSSFVEYLGKLRLKEARKLLVSSDRSIDEIALAVGFKNNSYFTSVFKKYEGITPSEYRIKATNL
ncbi:response regulator transcription factor [Desulfolucanica intricata]|uniref:response regulator transcription factor n=1 Tax=Desulfolucanica intricata TaxID=1285191 RepID=UPI0008332F0A|nr:response regulator [Desulfolucanica intricata]